jgi:hypothetical protein
MKKTLSLHLRRYALAAVCALSLAPSAQADDDMQSDDNFVLKNMTVAQRLGGVDGITAFIEQLVVPALVDSDLKRFFVGAVVPLTESTKQTVACLARLLDHDLGGSAPKNGAIVSDPAAAPLPVDHKCRSSMSNVHRGMNITDAEFDLFVDIVADEALAVPLDEDIVEAVGKVLNRYRGSITDK